MRADHVNEARRGHAAFLSAVARLEAGAQEAGPDALAAAAGAFLETWETTLAPFLEAEERSVYPLLDRHLPEEVRSPELLRRELATLRDLVPMLALTRERLRRGEPGADEEAQVLIEDLVLLAREHIRKEDQVVYPLLLRLLEEIPDA